jgi:hypothetical protein
MTTRYIYGDEWYPWYSESGPSEDSRAVDVSDEQWASWWKAIEAGERAMRELSEASRDARKAFRCGRCNARALLSHGPRGGERINWATECFDGKHKLVRAYE